MIKALLFGVCIVQALSASLITFQGSVTQDWIAKSMHKTEVLTGFNTLPRGVHAGVLKTDRFTITSKGSIKIHSDLPDFIDGLALSGDFGLEETETEILFNERVSTFILEVSHGALYYMALYEPGRSSTFHGNGPSCSAPVNVYRPSFCAFSVAMEGGFAPPMFAGVKIYWASGGPTSNGWQTAFLDSIIVGERNPLTPGPSVPEPGTWATVFGSLAMFAVYHRGRTRG